MKTQTFSKIVIVAMLLLTVFLPVATKAQITCTSSYQVVNNTGCAVGVIVDSQCNFTFCSTPSWYFATIPANSAITVAGCAVCVGVCDIAITLVSVNGTGLSPWPIVNTSGASTGTYSAAFCPGSIGSITWNGTLFRIK